MTLVNESPTQKPGRAARDHADVALKAAAEGRWQEAADANRAVLAFAAEIKVEERIEAQNRLAKCLWELGDLAGSKKEYQVTLTLDPLNRIAERNLERLKGLIKQVGKNVHHRPQHDIDAIASQAEHPCIGRLRDDFDQGA